MDLNPSTFVLEIVNFLVLVWLLKRFLYQPVSAAIEERRRHIAQTVADARDAQAAAEALRMQYESRLADWETEKRQAREAFKQELEAERQRAMGELEKALDAEREKARVLIERQRRDMESDLEREALRLSRQFAARFLERLAGPEMEAALLRMFGEDLVAMSPEQWQALTRALEEQEHPEAEIASAFPLKPESCAELTQLIETRTGRTIVWHFREDPALICGIRLRAGHRVLAANVAEELKFFADGADNSLGSG
ncbi:MULTISPECIES: F0F1 ATP synthase subunit delta [Methylococcus]|uniref:ATP synthase subunit b n=1 Tax=Methylococcus capsulatus TaxID=414 RepID=A0ABZ2F5R4_METCP|nr:F0F1 ATP synthase subunit delta [Methylococcus capsulatus]MDF9391100.1 F0F1 ATP synthase subunit B [Methylococcus capsulatus]